MSELKSDRKNLVIIGNGMVGYKLCEKLIEKEGGDKYNIIVFGEEPRPAYDRVQLTSYLSGKTVEDLTLAPLTWYEEKGIVLKLGEPIAEINREKQTVISSSGNRVHYDKLVFATGSSPFVPPINGVDRDGVFLYRTIEDLDAIRQYSENKKKAVVIGGGLLGLEAAKALIDLGLETHVIEMAPRLMPRQLDVAG
ncbi:MAG TPA: NAD(P)/FAD-dependent oxidoreductase, partial [Spirochaetes bacterium]|nr:NAD(P)/FAD-dependent oxidoreductase [Spirochaetota bacterium]